MALLVDGDYARLGNDQREQTFDPIPRVHVSHKLISFDCPEYELFHEYIARFRTLQIGGVVSLHSVLIIAVRTVIPRSATALKHGGRGMLPGGPWSLSSVGPKRVRGTRLWTPLRQSMCWLADICYLQY